MSTHADHLGPVPAEESARGQAYRSRVGDAAQADGAPVALIGNGPAESKQTDCEAPEKLETLGKRGVAGGVAIGKIERCGEADGRDQQGFCGEETDAVETLFHGGAMRADVRVSEGYGGDGGKRDGGQKNSAFAEARQALDRDDGQRAHQTYVRSRL